MIFFSFLEFGADMLRRQELWLPCGALRSKVANGVNGGISCVVRLLLRNMFLAPSRLATAGERVPLADGTSVLIRARQCKILADMDAR
eukprot:153453-Pyramimonas_sp.AAC.1